MVNYITVGIVVLSTVNILVICGLLYFVKETYIPALNKHHMMKLSSNVCGNWFETASNIDFDGKLLCADLLTTDTYEFSHMDTNSAKNNVKEYIYHRTCILITPRSCYSNQNGHFMKDNSSLRRLDKQRNINYKPQGPWESDVYTNYEGNKHIVHMPGVLCAKFKIKVPDNEINIIEEQCIGYDIGDYVMYDWGDNKFKSINA